MFPKGQLVFVLELVFLLGCLGDRTEGAEERSDHCYTQYVTVSVVKQVPSYSKHCTKVDDTKCKTIFKNAFTTQMETQCTPTFDTSCDTVLQTAYKQECKTIKDVECRIVNLEKYGKYSQKKICTEVPTQKCVPVPVKVEGQKCVNIPTQTCETVPVVASVPVPKKQCFKKPRKVCQTLVTTKPKIVTERIPKTICGHDQPLKQKAQSPKKATKPRQHRLDQDELIQGSINYPQKVYYDSDKSQSVNEEERIPVYQEYPQHHQHPQNIFAKQPQEYSKPEGEPQLTYKKEDIPLYEEPSNYMNPNDEYDFAKDDYEPEEYHIEPKEDNDYNEYKYNTQAQAEALQNYYKELKNQHSEDYYNAEDPQQPSLDPYYGQIDRNAFDDFENTNPFNNNFYNDISDDNEEFSESRKVESISSDKEKRDANDLIEEYISEAYSVPAYVEEMSNNSPKTDS
eukprot:TRINITY_DN11130_c0_g1_i1.p1 TRINITY_DN11130_c0_g1~~TRINITY_DN11130_c0_g1_i1.p1  ORF type:complete len:454 (+),score=90.20 TRINITY_DN11130_c0_g1_i1:37-1398(+)